MERLDGLAAARDRRESLHVIHYACESLYTATGHPPAVSCLVIRSVDEGLAHMFSRTEAPSELDPMEAEIDLLRRYFQYAQSVSGTKFVHWNMSKATYGFGSLEARYRHLTGTTPPRTRFPSP